MDVCPCRSFPAFVNEHHTNDSVCSRGPPLLNNTIMDDDAFGLIFINNKHKLSSLYNTQMIFKKIIPFSYYLHLSLSFSYSLFFSLLFYMFIVAVIVVVEGVAQSSYIPQTYHMMTYGVQCAHTCVSVAVCMCVFNETKCNSKNIVEPVFPCW